MGMDFYMGKLAQRSRNGFKQNGDAIELCIAVWMRARETENALDISWK